MSDQIHKDLMAIFRHKMKDPRVSWVTINDVEVTSDYSLAKIFWTVLDSSKKEEIAIIIEDARGFIRSELAKGLNTYTVPHLKFVYDESLERGAKLLSLMNKIKKEFADDEADGKILEEIEDIQNKK